MNNSASTSSTDEPIVRDWAARGRLERLAGLDCFIVDRPGRADALPVLWLHGFPSSSLDWRAVVDRLPERRMLLADFPGFGLSAKPSGDDYSYSLVEQADRVVALLTRRGIERFHLVAHDMGTSVACELLARRALGQLPVTIESLLLTNGSVYIEQARLTPSQKLLRSPLASLYARLASWRLFQWQIRRILGSQVDEAELRAMWQGMRYNDGIRALPAAIRYIDERFRFYRRWTEALAGLDLDATVVWGRRDPVAVAAIGQRLAATIPGARLHWLDHCGHFPMLEDPAAFAEAVAHHLDGRA